MTQNTNNRKNAGKREQAEHGAPKPPRSSGFASIVASLHQDGEIMCGIPAHHTKTSVPLLDANGVELKSEKGNTRYLTKASPRIQQQGGWKVILGMMMPGSTAACPCERIACETAWKPHHQDHVRYGSRYVQRGTYVMGLDGVGDRELFVSDLLLTKEVKERLAVAHPRYFFVSGNTPHSHPFMHITTQIASRVLIDRLVHVSGGRDFQITDLHGNPRSNARTVRENPNLKIQTIVEPKSAEDCIRQRNKWAGADYKVSSLRSCGTCQDDSLEIAKQDAIISIHSMYYYDLKEVSDCVGLLKDSSSFWAVMHKFPLKDGVKKGSPDDVGEFGHGEVKWRRYLSTSVHNDGSPLYLIKQWDVMTGKEYVHNDNSHWFERTSYWLGDIEHSENKFGMAWDISSCGPDTFLFQVVKAPASLCWTEAEFKRATTVCEPVFANARDRSIATGEVMPGLTVTAPRSFLEAKDALVGVVDRDSKRWSEHVSRYRRLLQKNKEHEDDLYHIALVCFFADLQSNREKLMIAFVSNVQQERKLGRALKKKDDPANWGETVGKALLAMAAIVSVARSPPEKVAAEVLGQVAHFSRAYA